MKLLIVADGDPRARQTNSGVASGIYGAAVHDHRWSSVVPVDGTLRGVAYWVNGLVTFRPRRSEWWALRNFGVLNLVARSLRLGRWTRRARADLTIRVRNIYLPSRRPFVVFIDSTSEMSNGGWSGWAFGGLTARFRRWAEIASFNKAVVICTAGQQARRSVIDDYNISPEKVVAVGGGVNVSPSFIAGDRPRPANTILFVGTDYLRKGGDLLVDAFVRTNVAAEGWTLRMVGVDGPAIPGVAWEGRKSDPVVLASYYATSRIFCHPARHEPYGLVVQEAMSFGLPCIVSDTGALSDIVDDQKTGLVVANQSVEGLSVALRTLVDDAELREALGAAGRRKAEASMRWEHVYGRIMGAVGALP